MPEQSALQPLAFDVGPAVKLYMDSVEAWRKSCERLSSPPNASAEAANRSETALPNYDKVVAGWQKVALVAFRGFVEQQIELCRFFEGRWEQYLHLQDRLNECRRPGELGRVHADFVAKLANDYIVATNKLARMTAH